MLKKKLLFIIAVLYLQFSCAPTVQYQGERKSRTKLSTISDIIVFDQDGYIPSNANILGSVYIGDSGLSVGCGFNEVIDIAKRKAIEEGGNAIQITEIKIPDFSSTCYRIRANILVLEEIKQPANWPYTKYTESDIKIFIDKNRSNLNPIEGIWNYNESGNWRNVATEETGVIPNHSPYRLAIIRSDKQPNYDFVAIILESEYMHWKTGSLKAYFRKTAYDNIFEGRWYMSDYSENKGNYFLDVFGLLTNKRTDYRGNVQLNYESTFIKAYPPIEKNRKLSSENLTESIGSGFIISKNGLVVTNYHVVEDAKQIQVTFPEKSITKVAKVKIKDAINDIVILELENFVGSIDFNEIPFTFTNDNLIKVGQEVYTLGFPLGEIMGTTSRLSMGVINSKFGLQDDPRLYQISNPIQLGNSGGPLFNSKGELIGIVVSSLNAKYFYDNIGIIPQNVNFAIKSSYLKNIISLLSNGEISINRTNPNLHQKNLEELIEDIKPYVVQIKAY